MPQAPFNAKSWAREYGQRFLKSDPGVQVIYYLPNGSPDREIRLIEVNDLMAEMRDDCLDPFEIGADRGQQSEHRLLVMDVTPSQWERIMQHQIPLPNGWSLEHRETVAQPNA